MEQKKITVFKFWYDGHVCLLPILDSVYNVSSVFTRSVREAIVDSSEFNGDGYFPIHFVVKSNAEFKDFCSSFFQENDHRKIVFTDVLLEEMGRFDIVDVPFAGEVEIPVSTYVRFPMVVTKPDGVDVDELHLPILNIKI